MKSLSNYLKTEFYTRTIFNVFLISVIYALFITGYRVFISDQTQYLLLPFRKIYPGFCVNDWFVWGTSHYHFSFSYLIQLLYYLSLGNIEAGMFIVWFVFLFAHIHSLYFLTESLGGTFRNFIIVIFLLVSYASVSLGDSITHSAILIPAFMAIPVTTYAFAFLFSGKYKTAFLFIGLAALIHVNFGVIGIAVFSLYLFLNYKEIGFRTIFTCLAIFFIVALPNFLPVLINFNKSDGWLRLSYFVRSPHHYDPRTFGITEWLETIIPVVLALWYFIVKRENKPVIEVIAVMICLFCGVLIINLLNGPLIFYTIYVWRFAPYLLIFSYIILSKALLSELKINRNAFWMVFIVVSVLLISHHGLESGLRRAVILCAGIFVFNKIPQYNMNYAVQTLILIFLIVIGNGYKGIDVHNKIEMMEWIKKNTPPDALFLTPPGMEGIRLHTHRSIVVNVKSAPIGVGTEMYEWKNRLEKITNSNYMENMEEKGFQLWEKLTEFYLNNSPEQVKNIMSFYNADYFITYTNHKDFHVLTDSGFDKVYQENNAAIFHLSK